MGLFSKLLSGGKTKKNSKSTTTIKNADNVLKQIEDEQRKEYGGMTLNEWLDYQDKLLSEVNAAQALYKENGDLDKVIKVMEHAFIESDPPCKTSQEMDLAKYYLKAGENDKAWRYLNLLLSRNPNSAGRAEIRFNQGRILKKEKKWSDALRMYMLYYLDKSEWNNEFKKEQFSKDVKTIIKHLGWDESEISPLSTVIDNRVRKRNYSEAGLVKDFNQIYKEISKKYE